jgi:nucleotide-binding universal stress UspA family protein
MLKKILVAFDDSEASQHAFDFACELAAPFHAKVLVVAVIRLPEPLTSPELEGLIDSGEEHYEKAFEALRKRPPARSVDVSTVIDEGHPAEHIVGRAEKEHVDMIVMGRRGRTAVARWMLGSISERVLRYAHCPVMVVK